MRVPQITFETLHQIIVHTRTHNVRYHYYVSIEELQISPKNHYKAQTVVD